MEHKNEDMGLSAFIENVLWNVDSDLLDMHEKGCRDSIMNYLFSNTDYKHFLKEVDGNSFVSSTIFDKSDFVKNYFVKQDEDLSARDCAIIILNRKGMPPTEYMSIDSLEKAIRKLFKDRSFKDKVFIKRSKGVNTLCVDMKTCYEIESDESIIQILRTQIKKAENNHRDDVEWRAYEFVKAKIKDIEERDNEENLDFSPKVFLDDEKTYYMVRALYNLFFTEYDFDKHARYIDEKELLDSEWDYGKRYQDLVDILSTPDNKNEFYKLKVQHELLDLIADKVADKIIKRIEEKEKPE